MRIIYNFSVFFICQHSCRIYVLCAYFLSTFSSEQLAQFHTNGTMVKGIQFYSLVVPTPFQMRLIHRKNYKSNFISKITGPISTKLGTKHPWVIYANEGPCPFLRGDSNEKVSIHRKELKIFFSSQLLNTNLNISC